MNPAVLSELTELFDFLRNPSDKLAHVPYAMTIKWKYPRVDGAMIRTDKGCVWTADFWRYDDCHRLSGKFDDRSGMESKTKMFPFNGQTFTLVCSPERMFVTKYGFYRSRLTEYVHPDLRDDEKWSKNPTSLRVACRACHFKPMTLIDEQPLRVSKWEYMVHASKCRDDGWVEVDWDQNGKPMRVKGAVYENQWRRVERRLGQWGLDNHGKYGFHRGKMFAGVSMGGEPVPRSLVGRVKGGSVGQPARVCMMM